MSSCFLAMDDAEGRFEVTLSLEKPSLSVHSWTNCSYLWSLIPFVRRKFAKLATFSPRQSSVHGTSELYLLQNSI